MEISPLQKERLKYQPKLPGMLRNGISDICVREGEATQSVADQEKIRSLFPNTYGKKEITFQKGANTSASKKQVVGVILSGGQAPGGHNVISGLYDALKATNRENVLLGFKGGPRMHTATQAGLISSGPAEQRLRHRSSSRRRPRRLKSMASQRLSSLAATTPTRMRLFLPSILRPIMSAYR